MKITASLLAEWYKKFNKLYFNNELKPMTNFIVSNNKSRYGQFRNYEWAIEVSVFYDRSERDYINTFLHEMCHAYVRQNYKGAKSHGYEWKSIAAKITRLTNGKYGTIQRCGGGQDKAVISDNNKAKMSTLSKCNTFALFIDYDGEWSVAKCDFGYIEKIMRCGVAKKGTKVYFIKTMNENLIKLPKRKIGCNRVVWNYLKQLDKSLTHNKLIADSQILNEVEYGKVG